MTDQTRTDDQILVTPEEAARRLSIGRTTIYELMARGELRSVNVGRCRRVPVSELCSFVARLVDGTAGQHRTVTASLIEQSREYDWSQRLASATVRRGACAERVASDETPALLQLQRVQPSRRRRA
jgi:excisionase family DNA binding protein